MAPKKLSSADKTNKIGCQGSVPFGDRKTNFRLIIYIHSSTNLGNLAQIGPVF